MLYYSQLCGKVEGSNEQDSSDRMQRGAMSRTVVIVCIVLRLIANYPRIIAVCGDNLNVQTLPLLIKGLVQE